MITNISSPPHHSEEIFLLLTKKQKVCQTELPAAVEFRGSPSATAVQLTAAKSTIRQTDTATVATPASAVRVRQECPLSIWCCGIRGPSSDCAGRTYASYIMALQRLAWVKSIEFRHIPVTVSLNSSSQALRSGLFCLITEVSNANTVAFRAQHFRSSIGTFLNTKNHD